ncbi:hypothetical protein O0I10_006055 [Lichtheimia ornata]|uniref:Uncharacterized protein n=1 Tax=Lichtheimia ornata TaxID=688661 RepID=A0AAD7XXP9_9FUNG|nr:uncharacterized protein O0I10_006055 [Lichtheimia ornata]KAJ8658370.1 hypothetical protein O0I10_006055 [Lichtheimia ornata]
MPQCIRIPTDDAISTINYIAIQAIFYGKMAKQVIDQQPDRTRKHIASDYVALLNQDGGLEGHALMDAIDCNDEDSGMLLGYFGRRQEER